MNINDNKQKQSFFERIRHRVIGEPRDINEPSLFYKISLIPILAWIGLGPMGCHLHLTGRKKPSKLWDLIPIWPFLLPLPRRLRYSLLPMPIPESLNTFLKVAAVILSPRIPSANGRVLLPGSALLVDYVLTIAVSLASCGDAIFSFLPPAFLHYKMLFVVGLIILLVFMNLRG